MRGVDTNVLVRYITQDDPEQALAANAVVEECIRKRDLLVIHPVVLCELVWVLESAYRFGRDDIVMVLDHIIRTAQFDIVDKDIVWQAFGDYQRGKADFSDYFIGRANKRAGADITLTFDQALRQATHFKVLTSSVKTT